MSYKELMDNIAKVRAGSVNAILAEQRRLEEQRLKKQEAKSK
jgi:hypothetical protein